MSKICLKNGNLVAMSNRYNHVEKGFDVLINDNKIEKIGKDLEIDNDTRVIDVTGKVIMPGLINTHAHVPMSIFRETLDGYDLQSWLNDKIWPMEDKLTVEDIYYASYLSFIEMIKTGTTTINDMYFMSDSIIKACIESGVRLQTTRTLIGGKEDASSYEKIEELRELVKKYNHRRLSFNVGIHGLYTCDEDYISKCVELAEELKLDIHIHFCENKKEREDIILMQHGQPVDILKRKMGDKKMILAHAVQLSDEEIEELSNLNVSVSHCPVSNLKLGCGIAKISKMKDCGINVSLGTDGQGSGSNLDLFETMKYTALLQKGINEDPKLFNAYDVLEMATINGAKSLGMEDKVGSIEEGKLADIIVVNLDDVKISPVNDVIAQLVYNVKGSNVDITIIDGKVLMENGRLIDDVENNIKIKCEEIISRIS